jgi:4-hydroxy-2-oxoheptanedioate aldolase
MQMLDAGARGIICPMIYTAQDAKDFVEACQYPPAGMRSFGPIRAQLYSPGNYFEKANEEILKFAMIETKEAYENLEEIAQVKGLTGIYVGPFDLSVSLGFEKKADFNNPGLLNILEKVLTVASRVGIKTGIFTIHEADAQKVKSMGFDLVTCGSETRILSMGAATLLHNLKK